MRRRNLAGAGLLLQFVVQHPQMQRIDGGNVLRDRDGAVVIGVVERDPLPGGGLDVVRVDGI